VALVAALTFRYPERTLGHHEARDQEARAEAERLGRTARAEAERMIETGEIQRIATERATQLVAQAEKRSDEVRRGANAYAREVLTNLETTVHRLLAAVEQGKQQLE